MFTLCGDPLGNKILFCFVFVFFVGISVDIVNLVFSLTGGWDNLLAVIPGGSSTPLIPKR